MKLFSVGAEPRLIREYPRDWAAKGFVPLSQHLFCRQEGHVYVLRTQCGKCSSPLEFSRQDMKREDTVIYNCPLCKSSTRLVYAEKNVPLDVQKEAKRSEVEQLINATDKPQDIEKEFWELFGKKGKVS